MRKWEQEAQEGSRTARQLVPRACAAQRAGGGSGVGAPLRRAARAARLGRHDAHPRARGVWQPDVAGTHDAEVLRFVRETDALHALEIRVARQPLALAEPLS